MMSYMLYITYLNSADHLTRIYKDMSCVKKTCFNTAYQHVLILIKFDKKFKNQEKSEKFGKIERNSKFQISLAFAFFLSPKSHPKHPNSKF